jgi:hypothetical protein
VKATILSRGVRTVIGPMILSSCCVADCIDGYTVRLDRLPGTPYRIEVSDRDRPQQAPVVVDCLDPALCGGSTRFGPGTPRNLRIRVVTAVGETMRDVQLDYDQHRPGMFCSSCASAEVTVLVPR